MYILYYVSETSFSFAFHPGPGCIELLLASDYFCHLTLAILTVIHVFLRICICSYAVLYINIYSNY